MTNEAERAANEVAVYAAFSGARRIARGVLAEVLPVLKQRFDRDPSDPILTFNLETGKQVEFDLRGSLEEVLDRELLQRPRGPGRPKLGVVSREVSLLPRHWEWLDEQPQGVSGALRRLVEQAIRTQPGKERARRLRAALSRFLTSMAGDRPNYEEASRALFAGETEKFESLVQRWPKDIRDHAVSQARLAASAEAHDESGHPQSAT